MKYRLGSNSNKYRSNNLGQFQIIFNNYRCNACGAEGDSRLLPLYCHMEKVDKHPGAFIKVHLKGTKASTVAAEKQCTIMKQFLESLRACNSHDTGWNSTLWGSF